MQRKIWNWITDTLLATCLCAHRATGISGVSQRDFEPNKRHGRFRKPNVKVKLANGKTKTFNLKPWSTSGTWGGKPRSFTINLMYGSQGNAISTQGGSISQNNGVPTVWIVGGVNLLDIPHLRIKKNAGSEAKNYYCRIEPQERVNHGKNINFWLLSACDVTYVDANNPTKRKIDDWVIESMLA